MQFGHLQKYTWNLPVLVLPNLSMALAIAQGILLDWLAGMNLFVLKWLEVGFREL